MLRILPPDDCRFCAPVETRSGPSSRPQDVIGGLVAPEGSKSKSSRSRRSRSRSSCRRRCWETGGPRRLRDAGARAPVGTVHQDQASSIRSSVSSSNLGALLLGAIQMFPDDDLPGKIENGPQSADDPEGGRRPGDKDGFTPVDQSPDCAAVIEQKSGSQPVAGIARHPFDRGTEGRPEDGHASNGHPR